MTEDGGRGVLFKKYLYPCWLENIFTD